MIQSEHIDRQELLDLLNSDKETDRTRSIGRHLHECASCRKKLDSLAAQSEVWDKAPELLNENSGFALRQDVVDTDTLDRPRHHQESGTEDAWEYPIEGLLDPPRHPEMLGRLGKYDIERVVGRGGMGIVFKAHDAELNRPLAIKALAPHLANHGTARQRFAQEARAAAGVIHPNVIAVHGVNNDGKLPFIVMPFVGGLSLQSLVEQNGPLTEIEIVRIGLQIAAGLTAAHSQGLVHRDIKPANILVEEGVNRVLITDFGLARAEDDASLTRTGWLTGTPNYMSPEQTRGQRIDHRSDLFSLGSLFYFLATGRLPFRSDSPLGVLNRIQTEEPTPVRHVNRQISKTLAEIIEMLLAKNVDERFQSAGHLHEILEQHLAYLHQPDVSKPPTIREKVKTAVPFRRWAVGLSVCSLLVVAAAAYLPTLFDSQPAKLDAKIENLPKTTANAMTLNGSDAFDNNGGMFTATMPNLPAGQVSQLFLDLTNEKTTHVKLEDHDWDQNWVVHEEEDCEEKEEAKLANQFEIGLNFHDQGKYDKAIKAFTKSAKLTYKKGISTYNIGCSLALQGKRDKALETLEFAFKYGFDDLEQFEEDEDLDSLRETERFKDLIGRLKQRQQANELIDKAKRANGNEDYETSVKYCRQAYALDQEYSYAALMLGYALHMQGKLDEALPLHRQAAASTDHAAIGNYNVFCVHALRKEKDLAVTAFRKSIEAGLADELSFEHFEDDSDLDSLREYPPFKRAYRKLQLKIRHGNGTRFLLTNGKIRVSTSQFTEVPESKSSSPISGKWSACVEDDEVQIQLIREVKGSDWKWVYVSNHAPNEFEPALFAGQSQYQWKQESGTISFEGKFDEELGEGNFTFSGDEDFRDELKASGVENAPDSLLFRFFFERKGKQQFLKNLKELKEFQLDSETCQTLALENVKALLVQAYLDQDLDVDKHLKFVVWRVKPKHLKAYVDSDLSPEKHEEFIRNRVPAKLIEAYVEAELNPEKMKSFIISRVTPNQIQEYVKEGFDVQKVKRFVDRRVPASLLAEYQRKEMLSGEYEDFIIRRVSPQLLIDYRKAGLALDENSRLIQRQVPAKLVIRFQDAGLDVREHQHFIQARVSPKLIKGYIHSGLEPNEYRYFLKRNVPAELISDYIETGLDPDKYSSLLKYKISPKLIKAYENEGLNPFKYRKSLMRGLKPEDAKDNEQC